MQWCFVRLENQKGIPGCSESIQKGLPSLRSELWCHIPCRSTSNSPAFPAATVQVGLMIAEPCSGWPIHTPSVKLAMLCIKYCFREDWVWNYLLCNSNLAGFPFNSWLGPCHLLICFSFFIFTFNYPLGWPEQLPVKPSLSVGLIPQLKSKKDLSKPPGLNTLRKYIMLRNSAHG